MAPLQWPRPPDLSRIPPVAASNAAKSYVRKVQRHMEKLPHSTTRYGVFIGLMLSVLEDAAVVFNGIHDASNTSAAVRHEIERFNEAIQSLGDYMQGDSVESHDEASEATQVQFNHAFTGASYISEDVDSSSSAISTPPAVIERSQGIKLAKESEAEHEGRLVEIKILDEDTAVHELMDTGMEELKTRLLQDFQDQGIRLPLLSCRNTPDQKLVHIFTSSKFNAAILGDPSFWRPTLFGKSAAVTKPHLDQRTRIWFLDGPKMRKTKEKARKSAKVVWLVVPDREFAKAHLMSGDLRSRVEQDLGAQSIHVQIESCKKSSAGSHIRIWAAESKDVFTLSNHWKPQMFGKDAYVTWERKNISMPSTSTAFEDAESSASLSDVPAATSQHRIEPHTTRRIRRQVFVEVPDQQFATTKLVGMKPKQLKSLVQQGLSSQSIAARVSSCHVLSSGTMIRIHTSTLEEAAYLKEQSGWVPMLFGEGAQVRLG
ncbi:MAG: hypothetical protein Q9170_003928 [Blastenia crenularia]